jgi:hypothetical protein
MTLARHWPLAASLVFCVTPALADSTTDCIDANEQSIQLRRDHKLVEARVEVAKCAAVSCTEDIRQVCVKDGKGQDLGGVTVVVDGAAPRSDPTVTALELDPGSHTFVFAAGGLTVERTFILREGEKQRHEAITLGIAPTPALAPKEAPAIAPDSTSIPTSRHPLRTAGIATGAVGVGGVLLGSIFGAIAASNWSTSTNDCPTAGCPGPNHAAAIASHDTAVTYATMSTVGFIAGGALLAAGIVLIVWPSGHASSNAALKITPGLGSFALGGSF